MRGRVEVERVIRKSLWEHDQSLLLGRWVNHEEEKGKMAYHEFQSYLYLSVLSFTY